VVGLADRLKPTLPLLAVVALHLGCNEQRPGDRGSASGVAPPASLQSSQPARIATPDVPPLLPGEVPPTDLPNYFDPRELGTGALVAFSGCIDTFEEQLPNASADAVGAICSCLTDATRRQVRAGQSAIWTDAQSKTCFESGTNPDAPSPFAAGLTPSTARIAAAYATCLDVVPKESPVMYQVRICACVADAVPKDYGKPAFSDDWRVCDIAARYAVSTGQNVTRRQFDLLRRGSEPRGQAIAVAPPVFDVPSPPGPTIRYPGNGLGPTPCADGLWSNSSGRGTCAGHGGAAGRRHRTH
jgi:hypothetical protein